MATLASTGRRVRRGRTDPRANGTQTSLWEVGRGRVRCSGMEPGQALNPLQSKPECVSAAALESEYYLGVYFKLGLINL